MSLPDITPVSSLDLTPEELDTGDRQEFINKMNSLQQKLETWSSSLHAHTVEVKKLRDGIESESLLAHQNRALNLLPDNGAFIDTTDANAADGWGGNASPSLAEQGMLNVFKEYNGASFAGMWASEVDRFYYNSSTHGGPESAISSTVDEWVTAMGMDASASGLRYMKPWAIARSNSGSGTAGTSYSPNGITTYYQMINTLPVGQRYSCMQGYSMSFWFKSLGSPSYVGGHTELNRRKTYLDGVELLSDNGDQGTKFHEIPANQIVHIAFSYDTSDFVTTVDNFGLLLLCRPDREQHWASLRVAQGAFKLEPHALPVRSLPGAGYF